MAFNNEYPYVDPNRVNTDWILNKFKEYIETIINFGKEIADMNATIELFKKEIQAQIENLNVGTFVVNKIDEMYQNGDFNNLIYELVPSKSLSFNADRLFRTIRNTGLHVNNSADYCVYQGGCHYVRNGIEYFAQACYNPTRNDDSGVVDIFSMDGTLVQRINCAIGHGNSVTYANDKLYIANGSRLIDGVETPTAVLTVIDLTDNSISYLNFDIEAFWGVASLNDDIYCYANSSRTLYKLFDDTLLPVKVLSYSQPNWTFQDICITSKYIYILCVSGNNIMRLPFETNNPSPDWIINIPTTINDRYYIGEPENITVDEDGTFWMGAQHRMQYYDINQSNCLNFFKGNFVNNIFKAFVTQGHPYLTTTFYVNTPTSNNPNGTSNNPFSSLSEALCAVSVSPYERLTIVLNKDCNNEYVTFISPKNVIIMANNHVIGGMYCSSCSMIILNAIFENCLLAGESSSYLNNCLRIFSSHWVSLYHCTFNPTARQSDGVYYNYSCGAISSTVSAEDWTALYPNKRQFVIDTASNVAVNYV